jgi:uncharacterized protein YodC (DUF2158 family)
MPVVGLVVARLIGLSKIARHDVAISLRGGGVIGDVVRVTGGPYGMTAIEIAEGVAPGALLEIGDVVHAPPWGGPRMTVTKRFPSGLVECSWSRDGDVEEDIFLEVELEVVE